MLSHCEMTYCVQQIYPGTENGKDYLIGHPVEENSSKQIGPAFVGKWNRTDLKQPTDEEIAAVWARVEPEYRRTVAAFDARNLRNELLVQADALVYRAEDAGDADRAKAARQYRQALRDVPQQAGFPLQIEWPTMP